MEWSPPSTTGRTPDSASGRNASAICAVVRSALPGVTPTSPQSTTDRRANTSTSCAGRYGRRSAEAERMASGPKRGPERKLVAVSKGTPTIAASTPSSSRTCGQRAKVRIPV
jgi:hypothetical protein